MYAQATITWLSSITTSSLAYMFRPSTSIQSWSAVANTLFVVFCAEHVYMVLVWLTSAILTAIPSWADDIARKEEYQLKLKFLDRSNHQTGGAEAGQRNEAQVDELFGNATNEGVEIIKAGF